MSVVRKTSPQLCCMMSLLIHKHIWVTHEKSKTAAVWCVGSDGVFCVCVCVSASGFQTLPTNIGTETFLGRSHTCTGSHAARSFPPSITSVCFFTHKRAAEWLFQLSAGGSRRRNIPCWVYQAIWMWLCKWALLDPCDSADIWSPHWLW